MPSSGKKKTTMAKLNREARLRDRRFEKAARKEARKYAAANPEPEAPEFSDDDEFEDGEEGGPEAGSSHEPAAAGEAT